jgi:hypothetical protein
MYCPHVQDGSPVAAYRITYSFSGPPLASDEYGNSHFTFSVNLRPEDLSTTLRETLSARRISRETAAKYFKVTTSRGLSQQIVIDHGDSAFCEGNYRDGSWTRTNANCQDRVTYKTVTAQSDYVAVKVIPVPSPVEPVAADSRRN